MSTRKRTISTLALIMIIPILTACGGTSSPATDSSQSAATANINHPADGSVIYASALYITGTASTPLVFRLEVIDASGEVLAETTVDSEQGPWSVELVVAPRHEPVEAIIRTLPPGAAEDDIYSTVSVVLSHIDQRPEGISGSITFPTDEAEMGGDTIPVRGFVSGTADNTIILQLVAPNGTEIDQQVINAINPYLIDLVGWEANLTTNEYTGPATIRATFPSPTSGAGALTHDVTISIIDTAG